MWMEKDNAGRQNDLNLVPCTIEASVLHAKCWSNGQRNSQGGAQFPTGGIARERFYNSLELFEVSRSGVTPGPTV
jgi:hypothetical protein